MSQYSVALVAGSPTGDARGQGGNMKEVTGERA
jgi:hypothetical protein